MPARQSDRTLEAARYGARIIEVSHGYLNVVQARARAYATERGACLVPFGGGNDYAGAISDAARSLDFDPAVVWCAAGSGTLARSLKAAWPEAIINAVEVGKPCLTDEPFNRHKAGYAYAAPCRLMTPFPADRYYEAKAWEVLSQATPTKGETLFWNVAG